MVGSLNKDMYCTANKCWAEKINKFPCLKDCNCGYYHRKWPTPKQFEYEYGIVYPDTGAVYVLLHSTKEWVIYEYSVAKRFNEKAEPVVCACAPWGRPPKDWKPG